MMGFLTNLIKDINRQSSTESITKKISDMHSWFNSHSELHAKQNKINTNIQLANCIHHKSAAMHIRFEHKLKIKKTIIRVFFVAN